MVEFPSTPGGLPVSLALRPDDAAAALGISRKFLYLLTKKGEIPAVKLGRAVLYPRAGLERWLADRSGQNGGAE
jgi:excisionase family DNA binding protein